MNIRFLHHRYMNEAGSEAPAGGAPAAQTTVATTPVVPLAIGDAPAAETPAAAVASTVPVVYDKTGDPGLDMALEFVGSRGFDADHPAMVAASKGDFSMIRAALGALGDKATGYENIVALAEQAHKITSEKAAAKAAADASMIHAAVGGSEQWEAIAKWAAANAEPEEKMAVNAALSQGGLMAKVMAQWLAGQYSKAPGTTVTPTKAVTKTGTAGKADVAGPLSAAEYAKEVQALRAKVGYGMDDHPEYKALQSRRAAGQRAGR